MSVASILRSSAILGGSGVVLGAFGAHYLKGTLEVRGTTEAWKTGVFYQIVHSVALLTLALSEKSKDRDGKYTTVANLWTAGILLFSGSIYGLSLGGPRLLGPITPIGGLLLIGGWFQLYRAAI